MLVHIGFVGSAVIAIFESIVYAVEKIADGRSPRSASPSTPRSYGTHRTKSGFLSVSRSTAEKSTPAAAVEDFQRRSSDTIATTITAREHPEAWLVVTATANA